MDSTVNWETDEVRVGRYVCYVTVSFYVICWQFYPSLVSRRLKCSHNVISELDIP